MPDLVTTTGMVSTPAAAPAPASEGPALTPTPALKGAFDAFEKAGRPQGTQAPPRAKPVRPGESRTPESPEPPAPDETDDEPGETVTDAATDATSEAAKVAAAAKPKRPSDLLREDREKQKARADALEVKHRELETRYKEAETKLAKIKEYEDKVTAMEKRNQQIEDEFRLHAFERSSEYKEKFQKPFVDAYQRGRQKVTALEVTTAEGETRAATPEDFDAIMQVSNDRQATRLAKEMFGDDYPIVIQHRENVLAANATKQNAIEEAKKNGSEREKQMQESSAKQRETATKAFETHVKEREAKLEFLKEVEGDQAWNDALKRGSDLAGKSWLHRNGESVEKQSELDAANYNRSRAYSTLKLSNKRLTAKVAELEKSLAEYQASEPGKDGGDRGTDAAPKQNGRAMDNVFAEIEKKAKPGRAQFY